MSASSIHGLNLTGGGGGGGTGSSLTQNSFAARTAVGTGTANAVITIGSDFSLSGNTLSLSNSYIVVGSAATVLSLTVTGGDVNITGSVIATDGLTGSALVIGNGTFAATVQSTNLTANRALQWPDQAGTLAIREFASKITAANYTVGTTNPGELYGGVIYVTAAATITIPAAAIGMHFTVITIGAVAVSVDPNAADLIIRDGTAQADGEKITNLSTAGDIAVLTYYDATGWHASTNGWTNGG